MVYMIKLTQSQINEIDLYLQQHKFFYIDLRAEILDAICCELEDKDILIDDEIRVFLDANIKNYKNTYFLLSKTNIKTGMMALFKILLKPHAVLWFVLINVIIISTDKYFNILDFISDAVLVGLASSIIFQPLYIKSPYFSVQNVRLASVWFILPFFIMLFVFKAMALPNIYMTLLIINNLVLSIVLFYYEIRKTKQNIKNHNYLINNKI